MTEETSSEMVTTGFGTQMSVPVVETASSAVAAQATASVQARYIVAMQRPRSWDEVRVKLLRECNRSGFAEVAIYAKPIGGKKIEGLSIRFAEAALRCATNMLVETAVIYDDDAQRIVRVSVTDLEANLTYPTDVVVRKTVERSAPRKDEEPISVRINSQGNKTYTIRATDDDLLTKQGALVSKAIRTEALRMIPGDILDACADTIRALLAKNVNADPDAEKKKIIDAFAALNVMPPRLVEYLGHPLEEVTPAEILELKSAYVSVREGEATFAEILELRKPDPKAGELSPSEQATKKIHEKLAKVKEPEVMPPTTPKEKWNAKGACAGCGRGQTVVEQFGHMPECPYHAEPPPKAA